MLVATSSVELDNYSENLLSKPSLSGALLETVGFPFGTGVPGGQQGSVRADDADGETRLVLFAAVAVPAAALQRGRAGECAGQHHAAHAGRQSTRRSRKDPFFSRFFPLSSSGWPQVS